MGLVISIIALAIGLWLVWAVWEETKLAKRIGSAGIGLVLFGVAGMFLTVGGLIGAIVSI